MFSALEVSEKFVGTAILIAVLLTPGFLLAQSVSIDYPGATSTLPLGTNDRGDVVGQISPHGFLLTGNSFSQIDFPGASSTTAAGISNGGKIVGYYNTAATHGFVLDSGTFTTIDFPGAMFTEVLGISSDGSLLTGSYGAADGSAHGFLFANGSFTAIDFPSATSTVARGVNDAGQIVGEYSLGGSSRFFGGELSLSAYRPLTSPDRWNVRAATV